MPRKRKKKISNKAKIAIASFLTVSIIYNSLKTLIFGNPPTKLRKALFYSSVGALFIYNTYGDDIGEFTSKSYNDLYGLINNSVRKENHLLTEQIDSIKFEYQSLRDSLAEFQDEPKNMKKNNVYKKKISAIVANDNNQYWYVVKKGDNLSDIASNYYGDSKLYGEIASENNIKNASNIKVGLPLLLNKNGLETTSELRTDKFPEKNSVIKRGETLRNHIYNITEKKSDINELVEKVLQYNWNKGNKIPLQGYTHIDEAVVYLPENFR